MKEAIYNLLFFHFASGLLHGLRTRKKLKVTRLGMSLIMAVVFTGFFYWQTTNYMASRPQNYFEVLELDNIMPSPTLVKKRYKEIMNRFAEESAVSDKPKAEMTPREREVEQKK